MESDQSIELRVAQLSGRLQSLCVEKRILVATAESLTGGGIGYFLTANSGSSKYYVGGTIAYSAEEKIRLLSVRRETVNSCGVVSEQCVFEMASGARRLHEATLCISVSGNAGPTTDGDNDTLGEVWIAVSYYDVLASCHHVFSGVDRQGVRLLTIEAAITLALDTINQS